MPTVQLNVVLWINGAIGLLTLASNSAAVLMLLSQSVERARLLTELSIWAMWGAVMIATSTYALVAKADRVWVVTMQLLLLAGLALALTATPLLMSSDQRQSFFWTFGILSLLGFYIAMCVLSVTRAMGGELPKSRLWAILLLLSRLT